MFCMEGFLRRIKSMRTARLALLQKSKTWSLREREVVLFRKTERAKLRAMCGAKLMNR